MRLAYFRALGVLAACGVVGVGARVAPADVVAFEFTGVVTSNSLVVTPFASAPVGATVVMRYSFDTSIPPLEQGGGFARYFVDEATATMTVGGIDAGAFAGGPEVGTLISVSDNFGFTGSDTYAVQAYLPEQFGNLVLNLSAIPGDVWDGTALPTLLDLDAFTFKSWQIMQEVIPEVQNFMDIEVTGFRVVPGPGAVGMLGVVGVWAARRKR